MSSLEKLKRRVRDRPQQVRFEELVRVLRSLGYQVSSIRGSHWVYRRSDGRRITVVRPHGDRNYCAMADVVKVVQALEDTVD